MTNITAEVTQPLKIVIKLKNFNDEVLQFLDH